MVVVLVVMDTMIVLNPDGMRSRPQTERRTLYIEQLISQVQDRSRVYRAPLCILMMFLTIRKWNIYKTVDRRGMNVRMLRINSGRGNKNDNTISWHA